jgi:hypothetical protein
MSHATTRSKLCKNWTLSFLSFFLFSVDIVTLLFKHWDFTLLSRRKRNVVTFLNIFSVILKTFSDFVFIYCW